MGTIHQLAIANYNSIWSLSATPACSEQHCVQQWNGNNNTWTTPIQGCGMKLSASSDGKAVGVVDSLNHAWLYTTATGAWVQMAGPRTHTGIGTADGGTSIGPKFLEQNVGHFCAFRKNSGALTHTSSVKATHPDFEYQPLFPPEELGDAGRVRWVSGTPGKPPAYAGTDFIVARNGRIPSVYLSFANLP
jgi:hypothetical protein